MKLVQTTCQAKDHVTIAKEKNATRYFYLYVLWMERDFLQTNAMQIVPELSTKIVQDWTWLFQEKHLYRQIKNCHLDWKVYIQILKIPLMRTFEINTII